MKFYLRIPLFACVLIAACTAQKKAEYELPEAMLPHVKVHYAQLCDKGRVLYEINCSRCHSTTYKHREIIPDFKPEELKGYELRVSNAKHEGSMPDTLVTAEELGNIMTFLSYKKKNDPKK